MKSNTEFVLQPNGLFGFWRGKDFEALNLDFDDAADLYVKECGDGIDRGMAHAYLQRLRTPPRRCFEYYCLVNSIAERGDIKRAEAIQESTKTVIGTPYFQSELR